MFKEACLSPIKNEGRELLKWIPLCNIICKPVLLKELDICDLIKREPNKNLCVYIPTGGMLGLCTDLSIRAVGLAPRQDGATHKRSNILPDMLCWMSGVVFCLCLFHRKKPETTRRDSHSRANKMMKGEHKPSVWYSCIYIKKFPLALIWDSAFNHPVLFWCGWLFTCVYFQRHDTHFWVTLVFTLTFRTKTRAFKVYVW